MNWTTTARRIVVGSAVALAVHGSAAAAEVRVMISAGFSHAYNALVPEFERRTADKVVTEYGPSMGTTPQAVPNRLDRGETADVLIVAGEAIPDLIAKGHAVAGTQAVLANSRIGMSVKAGAPKPDISTVEALKAALLAAKSVAYSDSASGVYITSEMFDRMGVAEQMKGKAMRIQATPVARAVAEGRAELGFQQIAELVPEAGADFVGPIPDGVQKITQYIAVVATKAKEPERARALIAYLASPQASPAIARTGLDPIAR